MLNTDRIEKHVVLKAPRSRVWKAISDSSEFGAWFGAAFEGPFVAGQRVAAQITHPPSHAGAAFEVVVEQVEPERLLSFRWHPDNEAKEPMTLVELRLEEVADGVALTIVESGFDQLAAHRRTEALRRNDDGWNQQIENIARHVAG